MTDKVYAELIQLRDAIAANRELRMLVLSPVLSAFNQESAIHAILKNSGCSGLLINFCCNLARSRRLSLLPQIATVFAERLSELRGEIVADITAVRALDAMQMQSLEKQLQQIFVGKKIILNAAIDPGILGGIKVRIGSTLIDASLKTKLDGLGFALKAVA